MASSEKKAPTNTAIEIVEEFNMQYQGIVLHVTFQRMNFACPHFTGLDHWYVCAIELPNKEWGFPFIQTTPHAPSTVPKNPNDRHDWLQQNIKRFVDVRLGSLKGTRQMEFDY